MKPTLLDAPTPVQTRATDKRFKWVVAALPLQLAVASLISVAGWRDLGAALFVATPLTVGGIAGFIRTWDQMWRLLGLLLVVPSVILLFVGVEGLLCVAMAAPLLAIVMMLGYGIGRLYAISRGVDVEDYHHAALWLPMAVFTVSSTVEHFVGLDYLPNETSLAVDLLQPPDEVFEAIIHVDTVKAAPSWLHTLGLPTPLASHLDTLAVGGKRKCYLSDGIIHERLTKLNAPYYVAMDMGEATMGRSWLRLWEDEYHLAETADGGTRITHTTHFGSNLRPRIYWAAVERYTVRAQHRMVFDNLKLDLATQPSID